MIHVERSHVTSTQMVIGDAAVRVEETGVAGQLRCRVRSPYQAGETVVRLVSPREGAGPRRVLWVLPVEAGCGEKPQYGDGLRALAELEAHEKFEFTLVAPGFSSWPWYADHATDAAKRQESHLMRVVMPLVDRLLNGGIQSHALLGFSKSGWGAFSLLLRYPALFACAVAWDSPFTLATPDRWGTEELFTSQAQFDACRPDLLVQRGAASLGQARRLAMLGYGNFREHHLAMHDILTASGVAHHHTDGPWREHTWTGGWLAEAAALAHEMTRCS